MPKSEKPKKVTQKPKAKRSTAKLTAWVKRANERMEVKWKKIWIQEYNKSIDNKAYERPGGPRLIAKRGKILAHHFAYYDRDDASILNDTWYQSKKVDGGKGQWHTEWQELSDPEYVEVIKEKDGVRHIADMISKNDYVIEFQHSPMNQREIREREDFYGDMFWVIDAKHSAKFIAGCARIRNSIRNFYAVKMDDWWGYTTKELLLDIGNCLIRPMFMSRRYMFGYVMQYKTFIDNNIHFQPIDNVEKKYLEHDPIAFLPDSHGIKFDKDNYLFTLTGNNYNRRELLKRESFIYNGKEKEWSIRARRCPPAHVEYDILF